jgi:lipopolysaccharide export LptBFGC system permease protein LptF
MPWLLYRMILSDLLRVIGLTAAVLVTVIAFGATIKPLASDSLLDARTTLKYLMLAIVPMLQFALPFSAGFGATLAMNRMTADNEVQAMAVSGLSYRRMLMPVAALGLALCAIMVVLTQEVIPRFWSLIEQTIASDVTKLFQASIRRGEPFKIGDMQIYADEVFVTSSPEGPLGPDTRLRLMKVAAAEMDEEGRIITDVTANQAYVDIYRGRGETLLKLAMYDTVAYRQDRGELTRLESLVPNRAIVIRSPLTDKTKAKSRSELLALRADPDQYGQVIEARQALADVVSETEARQALDAQLRERGEVRLMIVGALDAAAAADGAAAEGGEMMMRGYVVKADRMVDGRFMTRDGRRIEITEMAGDVGLRRFVTEEATLRQSSGARLGNAHFDLALGRYDVSDLSAGGGWNQREGLEIRGLGVPGASQGDLGTLPSEQLIARARALGRDATERIGPRINKVRNEIDQLQREITSRLLNRYALSVTAPLLLLLGAILAMYLKGALPLTIYLLSFLPSVIDLIVASAGEQLLRDGRWIGLPIMWSGNALIATIIGVIYWKLSRN